MSTADRTRRSLATGQENGGTAMRPVPQGDRDGSTDFDFLHGHWRVSNRKRPDPLDARSPWLEFTSSAEVRQLPGGMGNVDQIAVPDVPGHGPMDGVTLRLYEPQAALWRIHWTSTRRPGVLDPPLEGRFDGRGHGVFLGVDSVRGHVVRVRFDWTDLGEAGAVWTHLLSFDEGLTWNPNWSMTFQRDPDPRRP